MHTVYSTQVSSIIIVQREDMHCNTTPLIKIGAPQIGQGMSKYHYLGIMLGINL